MLNKAEKVEKPVSLYQKTEKIYPRMVSGFFARLRVLSVFILLGLFYVGPWITWNGRQAILFDLPARKYHLFGITFWPQDFILLTLLLIIAALALFFFSTIAGRLWCGFACPQTVWTETFVWIERLVEGERNQRIKLDKSPWTLRKVRLKVTKHLVWGLFALFTGYTFVGFFTPIRELSTNLLHLNLGSWEFFWVSLYSLATYGNAGFLREQVCLHMCPYSRFQSAMFDEDTLIISYDAERGEPRGHRKKEFVANQQKERGDCIDCRLCVNVCPTGIDIRDGLQYECISCAACIDVCDDVMEQVGYDKGLIRFSTENTLKGKGSRILRPRTFLYASALLILMSAFLVSVSFRVPVELDITRDRQSLYTETSEGLIQNIYTIKVSNKSQQLQQYAISASGIADLELSGERRVSVEAGQIKTFTYRLTASPKHYKKYSNVIYFTIQSIDEEMIRKTVESRFLGPF